MERKNTNTFLLKQRGFLKGYLIKLTEEERLYGLEILGLLRAEFKDTGYRPNHSEIYKSLHELLEEGILERYRVKKEGMDLQEVIYYKIKDKSLAARYKRQLKQDLDRSVDILQRAIKDIY